MKNCRREKRCERTKTERARRKAPEAPLIAFPTIAKGTNTRRLNVGNEKPSARVAALAAKPGPVLQLRLLEKEEAQGAGSVKSHFTPVTPKRGLFLSIPRKPQTLGGPAGAASGQGQSPAQSAPRPRR